MDKNQCEFFAQFTYADRLTYDELLNAESALISRLEEILSEAGGQHLDYTPLGDMLRCQCAFESLDVENFRQISGNIAAILPDGITGRLFFLDKCLTVLYLFWLRKDRWEELTWPVPTAAPANAAVHQVAALAPDFSDGEAEGMPT